MNHSGWDKTSHRWAICLRTELNCPKTIRTCTVLGEHIVPVVDATLSPGSRWFNCPPQMGSVSFWQRQEHHSDRHTNTHTQTHTHTHTHITTQACFCWLYGVFSPVESGTSGHCGQSLFFRGCRLQTLVSFLPPGHPPYAIPIIVWTIMRGLPFCTRVYPFMRCESERIKMLRARAE